MTTMLTTTEAETLVADAHAVCALLPAHLGPNKTQSQRLTECELIAKVWKTLHSVFDVHTHALPVDQEEVMRLRNTLKSINAIDYGKYAPSWKWYELVRVGRTDRQELLGRYGPPLGVRNGTNSRLEKRLGDSSVSMSNYVKHKHTVVAYKY